MYNTLLTLSRNIFFYKKLGLEDSFETRLYLIFIHFSVFMIIFKKKETKFDQKLYDDVFHNIENDLRELGFGDVTVNKKMKEFNKILYDILLKLDLSKDDNKKLIINSNLVIKYFNSLKYEELEKSGYFNDYFYNFFNYCFELPLHSMLEKAINFKN